MKMKRDDKMMIGDEGRENRCRADGVYFVSPPCVQRHIERMDGWTERISRRNGVYTLDRECVDRTDGWRRWISR